MIHSSGIKAEVNRWDDPATFNSAPQALLIEDWWPWLRIEDDGVDHIAYLSEDGVPWLEVSRAPRPAFLTADQVYVAWNRNRATSATPGRGALTIQHWEVL